MVACNNMSPFQQQGNLRFALASRAIFKRGRGGRGGRGGRCGRDGGRGGGRGGGQSPEGPPAVLERGGMLLIDHALETLYFAKGKRGLMTDMSAARSFSRLPETKKTHAQDVYGSDTLFRGSEQYPSPRPRRKQKRCLVDSSCFALTA